MLTCVVFDTICVARRLQWLKQTKGAHSPTVIYLDVLIFVNVIVNYLLLLITVFFTKEQKKTGRLALSAFVGALFSLVILLPSAHLLVSLLVKAAGALCMAAIAFGVRGARRLLRNAVYLFVSSALLAGGVMAAGELLGNRSFLARNMGIYINMSPLTLIIVALGCYLILSLIEFFFKKSARIERACSATLRMGQNELKFRALLDSGNRLYDTLTGRDAIVLKQSLAKKLLNTSQLTALQHAGEEGAARYLAEIGDFALLPYTSIGGTGLLLGFGAKSCELQLENGRVTLIDRPFVAFTPDAMLSECDGIIGCDTLEVTV